MNKNTEKEIYDHFKHVDFLPTLSLVTLFLFITY